MTAYIAILPILTMKLLFLGLLTGLALLAGGVHALRLTDGLYFTVAPNFTAEVYFILPDDLGTGQGKADYYVTTDSNWSTDLTQQTISTEENNTVITPIRFFSWDKKEGDCSNYTVKISAPGLSLSRTWRGGVCLSKYADADIAKPGKDPGSVLDSNADIFSLGFSSYTKTVRPGDVSVELLLQSQANLTIDVSVESSLPFGQKSFVVQTSQSSQRKTLLLNASNILSGTYDIKATGKARACPMDSCTRQASMRFTVSDSEPQEGFSVSLFPENLAIKKLEPVTYRLTLQNNYAEERAFVVNLEKPLDLDSSLILDTFTVPGLSERTVEFTVTPRNQTGFYEIKATASSKGVNRLASAYLSVNEMVSDAYRNVESIKSIANSSLDASVDRTVRNWYSSYSKGDGQNLTEYKNLQDALDSARRQALAGQGQNQTGPGQVPDNIPEEETEPAPFNFWIILVPAALGLGVLLVLLLLRKRKGNGQEFLELK